MSYHSKYGKRHRHGDRRQTETFQLSFSQIVLCLFPCRYLGLTVTFIALFRYISYTSSMSVCQNQVSSTQPLDANSRFQMELHMAQMEAEPRLTVISSWHKLLQEWLYSTVGDYCLLYLSLTLCCTSICWNVNCTLLHDVENGLVTCMCESSVSSFLSLFGVLPCQGLTNIFFFFGWEG